MTHPWQTFWVDCAAAWDALVHPLEQATGWLVVNPARYGARWHAARVETYPPVPRPILMPGLNPGPYGMTQSGVPFTDIKRLNSDLPRLAARLKAEGAKLQVPGLAPAELHRYLVLKHEQSSARVYNFFRAAYGDAETALTRVVNMNSCPLLFTDPETGKNKTPADLKPILIRRNQPAWSEAQIKDLLTRVAAMRIEWSQKAIDVLNPRGVILLGQDVQKVLLGQIHAGGPVVSYPHPARTGPAWEAGLVETCRGHNLL